MVCRTLGDMALDELGLPVAPYDEVVPGLFQASSALSPVELLDRERFDAMFDLCGVDRSTGVEGDAYTFHAIDDVPWFDDAQAIDELGTDAARLVLSGKRVVVACMSGLNRSGLLVARCLVA